MSSRNALLDPDERRRALALPAALRAACELASAGERRTGALLRAATEAMAPFDVEPEYVAIVDPDTFAALDALDGTGLLVLAARVGEVRLIDNVLLAPVVTSIAAAAETQTSAAILAGASSGMPTSHLHQGEPTTCSA
jgi:pantoate--beta-alanine ligase